MSATEVSSEIHSYIELSSKILKTLKNAAEQVISQTKISVLFIALVKSRA